MVAPVTAPLTPGVTDFGTTAAGDPVQRVVIGAGDLSAAILTRGAVLQDVRLAGRPHTLTAGSADLAAYEGDMAYCGAIVGPVANRIAQARAQIDGTDHHFEPNFRGKHTLHGGATGPHAMIWDLAEVAPDRVTLTLTLPDGRGGFPGTRRITAHVRAEAPATLTLTLDATTDAPTLLNLANHSFWRLSDAPTMAGHTLAIHADRYTPVDAELIPTGAAAPVEGTRFDFRAGRPLTDGGDGLIDHNFCLADARGPLRPACTLTAPDGLRLEMSTTEPGLQVFDGHTLDLPHWPTQDGGHWQAHAAIALEAQFWPDAPNQPGFPSILLTPGAPWQQVTRWRFGHAA